MKPDLFIKVRFKTPEEGGRKSNIKIRSIPYSCVFFVDKEAFDCRLLLKNKILELGKEYELPIKFWNPDLVLPKTQIGKIVTLWEGKNIASGEVIRKNNL